MNEFLAEIYNTRETIGASSGSSDVEKLAEAQLLDRALQNEGIDVNTLSGDQIVKVAHHLFGDNSEIVKMAQEEGKPFEGKETSEEEAAEGHAKESEGETQEEKPEEEAEKQSMAEKIAEADLLGRVMAHSFVNEQAAIEKDAGAKELAGKAWEGIKKIPGAVKGAPKAVSEKAKAMKGSYEQGKMGIPMLGIKSSRLKGLKQMAKEHKKTVGGLAALGVAGVGGAGYGAKKLFGKEKKNSALDVLAEQRALEILKEAGVVQQTEEEKLAEAVEQRAYEMLQEHGYLTEGEGE
jgi:hypothetical protein